MKKIYILSFLLVIIYTQAIYSQQGSSILFDITQYNVSSLSSIKINGSALKGVYLQQGIITTGQGTEGGYYIKLNDNRLTWSPVNFLNAQCCVNGSTQTCFPLDYFFISRVNSSLILFNGVYNCGMPLQGGDYTKLSSNGGATSINLPFASDNLMQECRGFDIDPVNPQIMYMGHTYYNGVHYNEPRVFKSIDGGTSWFVTDTLPGMRTINSYLANSNGYLKVCPWDPNIVFTSVDNYTAYSTNGGYDFLVRTDLPAFKIMIFDEGDANYHGVAPDNVIWCKAGSPNGNWLPASNAFNIISVEINPDDHFIYYAGSDNNGIYKSTNRGVTFHPYNNTFAPSKKVIGIAKDAGSGDTIIVATDKRVYKVWESVLVGVNHSENSVPPEFKLEQNYPNPFNPKTIINYELGITNYVTLKVYDVNGKEVATLVNENQNAGSYNYQLSTDNYQLTSGIYFYKLTAGNFSETKRMVLLK